MRSKLSFVISCLVAILATTLLAGNANAQTKPTTPTTVQAAPAMGTCNIGTRLAIDTARKPSSSATKIHWPGGPVNMTEREYPGSNRIITVRCNLAERDVWIENGHLWVPECGNDFAPLSVDMPQMSSVGPEGPKGDVGPQGPAGPAGPQGPAAPAPTAKAEEPKPAVEVKPETKTVVSACSIDTSKMIKSQRKLVEDQCEFERKTVQANMKLLDLAVERQRVELAKFSARTVESICTDTTTSQGVTGDASMAQAFASNQPVFASAGAGATSAWFNQTVLTKACSMTPSAANLQKDLTKITASSGGGGQILGYDVNRGGFYTINGGGTGGGWSSGLSLGAPSAVMGNNITGDATVPVKDGPIAGKVPGNHVATVPAEVKGVTPSGQPQNYTGSSQVNPGSTQPGKVPGNHVGDSQVVIK